MEPIPENDAEFSDESPQKMQHNLEINDNHSPSKHIKKEVFCTEEVKSIKRLIAEEKLNDLENRYLDTSEFGPAEMSSVTYKYSYESTSQPPRQVTPNRFSPPKMESYSGEISQSRRRPASEFFSGVRPTKVSPEKIWIPEENRTFNETIQTDERETQNGYLVVENDERVNIERQLKQTEKVTRVTKVTTTRTIQQLPLDEPGSMGGVEYRILSPSQAERVKVPGSAEEDKTGETNWSICPPGVGQTSVATGAPTAPGAPQVVDIDSDRVTVVWLRPERASFRDSNGSLRAPFEGYQVHFRLKEDVQWYVASQELILEPLCTIENLKPNAEYELRIVAKNLNGYGPPSLPTTVQLRPCVLPVTALERLQLESDVPSPPAKPQAVDCDGLSRLTLQWDMPLTPGKSGPIQGYLVQYRPVETTGRPQCDWLNPDDRLIDGLSYSVCGLRPNGDYEFRVLAKNSSGFSEPSPVSDVFRMEKFSPSTVPIGRVRHYDQEVPLLKKKISNGLPYPYSHEKDELLQLAVPRPGRPYVIDYDSDWATLAWSPVEETAQKHDKTPVVDRSNLHFIMEYRLVGEPRWNRATDKPIFGTQFTVSNLRANGCFEFRILPRNQQGMIGEPSQISDTCQLKPIASAFDGPAHSPTTMSMAALQRQPPAQPKPPEIVELIGDCVTLRWTPSRSHTHVQGYQVDFRDCADGEWLAINQILTHALKMSIGDLLIGHSYQFRVTAKNSIGYSLPSDPSQVVQVKVSDDVDHDLPSRFLSCLQTEPSTSRSQPLQAMPMYRESSFTSDVPLPVEMSAVKESPPITDTDDSPPPMRKRSLGPDGVTYRDPTLSEVLDYLICPNNVLKLNAAGYLQHLTFNDEIVKNKVRDLKGIPRILDLLKSDVPEIQKNACGCLRNLSYANDLNKKAIMDSGGVPALAGVVKRTPDTQILEEASSVLWNLSSHDDLKSLVLDHCTESLIKLLVVPYSGWSSNGPLTSQPNESPLFRNSTGVLRNVSCGTGGEGRRRLRQRPGLIEALVHYLHVACHHQQFDTKSTENVICLIRNLCYRLQEMDDPNYDGKPRPVYEQERSRSVPTLSPKSHVKKQKTKHDDLSKSRRELRDSQNVLLKQPAQGVALLWQPEVVRDYLKLLNHSTNPDTLEGGAGTVQNLSACYWKPSVDVRCTVRKEKGLAILDNILSSDDIPNKVVCAAATALRNLAIDPQNRALIGKYTMDHLVSRLPIDNGLVNVQYNATVIRNVDYPADKLDESMPDTCENTVAAVLSVIYAVTVKSADFTRTFLEKSGVQRLVYLSNSTHYGPRVSKYASQILFSIWQHRELHDAYKKAGFKAQDFVTVEDLRHQRQHQKHIKGLAFDGIAPQTLARPISSKGGCHDATLPMPSMYGRPSQRDNDHDSSLNPYYSSTGVLSPRDVLHNQQQVISSSRASTALMVTGGGGGAGGSQTQDDSYDSLYQPHDISTSTPLLNVDAVYAKPHASYHTSSSRNGPSPTYAQIHKKSSSSRQYPLDGDHRQNNFSAAPSIRTSMLSPAPQQPMDSWV